MYINDLSWFGLVVVSGEHFPFLFYSNRFFSCFSGGFVCNAQSITKTPQMEIHSNSFSIKTNSCNEILMPTRKKIKTVQSVENAKRHIKCAENHLFSEQLGFVCRSPSRCHRQRFALHCRVCVCAAHSRVLFFFLFSLIPLSAVCASASISPVDNSFKFNTLTHLPCHLLLIFRFSLYLSLDCSFDYRETQMLKRVLCLVETDLLASTR